MTHSITKSFAGVFCVAAAALTLSACGAATDADTAKQKPAVPGANANYASPSGTAAQFSVRDAMLAYPGTEGFKTGDDAVLQARLFNETRDEVKVDLSCDGATVKWQGNADSKRTMPAHSVLVLDKASGAYAELTDLKKAVRSGESVPCTFSFGTGGKIAVNVPVGPPANPAPREKVSMDTEGGEH